MYLIDFIKSLGKKNNIGIAIWLILNATLVTIIFGSMLTSESNLPQWAGYVIGFGVYLISISIALSPVGEWILRMQQGCRKISDPVILARIMPLFDEVHAKAKTMTPNLDRNIRIFMSDEDDPNAFATGRNTVCVTRGLLRFSDEEIKATLAHEFGHLAHKDTDALLVVAVGNMIVSAIFIIYRLIFRIMSFFFVVIVGFVSENIGAIIAAALTRVFVDFVLVFVMWLWTKIGVLLCLSSSRSNEFKADEYAYNLQYGYSLRCVLEKLGGSGTKGLWAALNSSHPKNVIRIEKLNSYSI